MIDMVQILDRSGLLGCDDLREAFEEADEDDERARAFAALLVHHPNAVSDMQRLVVDNRLRALRLAAAWQAHLDDRARSDLEWLTAAQLASRYGVTPQAVYKWIDAGRVEAERTPGGSWRLPTGRFAGRERSSRAAAALEG